MPYPVALPETALSRFFLIWEGQPVPFAPTGAAELALEPGEGADAGAFYLRKKLASELVATGDAYEMLLSIERSSSRCTPIGLLIETRERLALPWAAEYLGTFTCSECAWDYDKRTVGIKVTTDDPYRRLLESWGEEYNILSTPETGNTARRTVSAELVKLAANISIDFLRIDSTEEQDYIGTDDAWTVFLRDTSWIGASGTQGGTYQRNVILFRYRLRAINMIPPTPGNAAYTPVDKSEAGWRVLLNSENSAVIPHTIDYVKQAEIAGFKTYKIGTYNDWNDVLNPGRTNRYDDQLLVLPCGSPPSVYGYNDAQYIPVTYRGGAENDNTGCLDLRRNVGSSVYKSVWWKFGSFKFGRCFPLLDGLHQLLRLTIAGPPPAVGEVAQPVPASLAALLPPSPALLSTFFSAATNPATGETGAANELPRLLLSAASDVKRYKASEAATRVLISLKTILADLAALYDVGAFVDPATGWLRIEHRSFLRGMQATGAVLDLTAVAGAILPRAYSYRQQQLPRYEEITVANASTEDDTRGISYAKAAIRYGSDCANTREGQNKTTRSASRLTGDVTGLVLSGDAIPDNALALLAPDVDGRLSDANRVVSATSLLRRYHREGRVRASGATVGAEALAVNSARPGLEQAECSAPLGTLGLLADASTRLITSLGPDAVVGKASLNLRTGIVKITPWLPTPEPTTPAPPIGRQFSDQFTDQFA